MTDNGHAALAVAFFDLTRKRFAAAGLPTGPFEWDHLSDADREKVLSDTSELLGPRGVFLPEGLGPVMVGMAKEIAALRAALVRYGSHIPSCERVKWEPEPWADVPCTCGRGRGYGLHAIDCAHAKAWETQHEAFEGRERVCTCGFAALAAAKETP